MPSRDPEDAPSEPAPPETPQPAADREASFLRTDLPPAVGVGALMGFLAATEHSGLAVAVVVGVVGCLVVVGMLALKRAFYGR